jgi:hypothetical protein
MAESFIQQQQQQPCFYQKARVRWTSLIPASSHPIPSYPTAPLFSSKRGRESKTLMVRPYVCLLPSQTITMAPGDLFYASSPK